MVVQNALALGLGLWSVACAARRRIWGQRLQSRNLCRLLLLVTAIAAPKSYAAAAPPVVGLGNRQLREEAIEAIPFERMTQKDVRDKLWQVVSDPSIYRRMPEQTVACDPEMYVFLVRHPEVVVNMWQLMGVTNVTVDRTSPLTFNAADGAGTVTNVELVYGSPQIHIFYAEGRYEGALLAKRLTGRCVIVLRSNYGEDEHHRLLVSCTMDVFLQVDNLGIDLLAKTLNPLVGNAADHNFAESAGFLGAVSQAAETKTDRVLELASRLDKIDAGTRDTFTRITAAVASRAVREGEQRIAPASAAQTASISDMDESTNSPPRGASAAPYRR